MQLQNAFKPRFWAMEWGMRFKLWYNGVSCSFLWLLYDEKLQKIWISTKSRQKYFPFKKSTTEEFQNSFKAKLKDEFLSFFLLLLSFEMTCMRCSMKCSIDFLQLPLFIFPQKIVTYIFVNARLTRIAFQ